MGIFEYINHTDQQLFLFLNGMHCSFLDGVMWEVSKKTIWIPFYAVLVFFMARERKWNFWITAIAIGLTILISDQVADLIKDTVQRYRPTHDPVIGSMVHFLHNYQGGSYGFVSSHASNCFAIASFTALFFKRCWFTVVIFMWAILVSYSRIYLGVHYPMDVFCGGLVGLAAGGLLFFAEKNVQLKFTNRIRTTHRHSEKSQTTA